MLAIVLTCAVVLGGLAFVGYRIYLNEVDDAAIELVPSDAIFYANVYLNPSTRQKKALRDLLRHFPDAGTPEETRATLDELFDNALAGLGLEFARDVEPWLGRQVGAFARVRHGGSISGAILFGTTDTDAALRAARSAAEESGEGLDSRSYSGVDYDVLESGGAIGIVDDFLVVAAEEADLRASVDAASSTSLAESETFLEATESLPEDRVALFYANVRPFIGALEQNDRLPVNADGLAAFVGSPAAVAVYLRPDAIVLDATLPESFPEPGSILGDLPEVAWAVFGIDDVAGLAEEQFDLLGPFASAGIDIALQDSLGLDLQDDVLTWAGDLGLYATGDVLRPEAALVIESTDEAASAAAMRDVQRALIGRGIRLRPFRRGPYEGFEAIREHDPETGPAPAPVVVLYGEKVVLADSR
ncbi:MAG TPA: DUF3352 domain-containing protein, partial [Actinomycetota bacterium]